MPQLKRPTNPPTLTPTLRLAVTTPKARTTIHAKPARRGPSN
jgi:hypothetical protein